MGCDIHAHTEIKVGGRWEHLHALHIPRSYTLFEKMAGVRGSRSNAVAPPRGLPLDGVSVVTALDYQRWAGDAHTPSWLSHRELAEVIQWLEADRRKREPDTFFYGELVFGYLFSNGWETPPDFIQDARIVFWFDN